jgi:hypothetical protein
MEYEGRFSFNRSDNIDRPITQAACAAYVEGMHGVDTVLSLVPKVASCRSSSNWFDRVAARAAEHGPLSTPATVGIQNFSSACNVLCNLQEVRPGNDEYDWYCSCMMFMTTCGICSHVLTVAHLFKVLNIYDISARTPRRLKSGRPPASKGWDCMAKPEAVLKVAGGGSGLLPGVDIDQNPTAALRQHVFFPEYGVGIVLRAMVKSAKKWLVFFETLNEAVAAVQAMACIHCPALSTRRCKVGKSLHMFFSTAELQVGLLSYEARIAEMVRGWEEDM